MELGTKAADGASSSDRVFLGCGAAGDVALQANQEASAARGQQVFSSISTWPECPEVRACQGEASIYSLPQLENPWL